MRIGRLARVVIGVVGFSVMAATCGIPLEIAPAVGVLSAVVIGVTFRV